MPRPVWKDEKAREQERARERGGESNIHCLTHTLSRFQVFPSSRFLLIGGSTLGFQTSKTENTPH